MAKEWTTLINQPWVMGSMKTPWVENRRGAAPSKESQGAIT